MTLLRLNWSEIDTVLLDMDGTILDLSFDDYIWNKEIPRNLARRKNIKFNQAFSILEQKMKTVEATLTFGKKKLISTLIRLKKNSNKKLQ